MGLVQLTPPASEPISLADAKNHLRIDSDITSDDTLINLLISAARRYGETITGRSFITQQWRLTLDGWASGLDDSLYSLIELPRGDVQRVDQITYLDMSRVQQTLDLSTVAQDLSINPARLTPIFGTVWPPALPQIAAVKIDYTTGYGDSAASVPEGIRQWMLVRISTLYEHREEVEVVSRGKVEPMPFVDSLLDPYRVLVL
jgi:uncharacterized phiE125 gp8 family phage protein